VWRVLAGTGTLVLTRRRLLARVQGASFSLVAEQASCLRRTVHCALCTVRRIQDAWSATKENEAPRTQRHLNAPRERAQCGGCWQGQAPWCSRGGA